MQEVVGTASKATIARQAIQNLLTQFSGQIAFGMALFPHWPHIKDCSHAQVNIAPSTTSGAAINTLLTSNYPEGNTPIAASLERVGAFLETNSTVSRYVILVTDAKETCLSPVEPVTQPGTCDWQGGTNYRKCSGCGWQFCLSSGNWSLDCEGNEELFGCTYGQTCSTSTGACTGTAGAMTAQAAAQALAAKGIKTYVVGFGSQVDATALAAIASSGGTGSYYQADNLTQLSAVLTQIAGAISCCNNGVLDAGEKCDTAIPAGQAGACPLSCDDGDACTADYIAGQACQQECATTPAPPQDGDGCCPPGATYATDKDCADPCGNGKLDAGETCDTAIAAGQAGACPTTCNDSNACTTDAKIGSGCQQQCEFTPVTTPVNGDGCCPAGATSGNDTDCPPEDPCGNGVLDAGEKCDTAIAAGQPGACPPSCDDANPCTNDTKHGSGCNVYCAHTQVTTPLAGDGCCPPGATSKVDSDCPELCGNGVLDAGEKCDTKIPAGQAGSCVLNCDDQNPCTRDQVIGTGCEVQCSSTPLGADPTQPDGCCPDEKMSQTQDADCLPPCTPDQNQNCVNNCTGIKCPDGQYCADGKCLPWPDGNNGGGVGGAGGASDGCDCHLNSTNPGPLPVLGLLLGLLLWGRRRRS